MNRSKKFTIIFVGMVVLTAVGGFLFKNYIGKMIGDPGKLMNGFVSNAPVFQSGIFSDDGNYFAYTYKPEVEKPDVDGSITMRGFAYPTYFQIMETSTGKKILDKPYESDKNDQMHVVWAEDNLVWLMKAVSNKGNQLALYDMKANKFRFEFGELEKRNPAVSWEKTNGFFINPTPQKGLLLETNDKRYYRIDPSSGKAETVQGKLEMVEYNFADDFQVSDNHTDYRTDQINGSRESITDKSGKAISQDDFIEVNFLTLTKNKKEPGYDDAPITYYKNYFFVLSPVSSDNEKDMELTMLDKNTLKTAWKLQLPQKKLKTFIPRYGYERFFIKGDKLLVTNNNYLITIDLTNGKILRQEDLYG